MSTPNLPHRFRHHPPRGEEDVRAHERIRATTSQAAHVIDALVPDGREKSLALTALEEAMMWANAGIARGGTATDPRPRPGAGGPVTAIRDEGAMAAFKDDSVRLMAEQAAAAGKLGGLYTWHEDGYTLVQDVPALVTKGEHVVTPRWLELAKDTHNRQSAGIVGYDLPQPVPHTEGAATRLTADPAYRFAVMVYQPDNMPLATPAPVGDGVTATLNVPYGYAFSGAILTGAWLMDAPATDEQRAWITSELWPRMAPGCKVRHVYEDTEKAPADEAAPELANEATAAARRGMSSLEELQAIQLQAAKDKLGSEAAA
jgi:hypothetical protein